MLGGVFEGLGVPWKRPGGTLGASWAILGAAWESCRFSNDLKGLGVVLDAAGRRLEMFLKVLECLGSVLEAPWERLGLSWRLPGSLADFQTI